MNPTPQDAVDKTLARLAAVEIPHGLEQRILARLAANPTAVPFTTPSPRRSALPWWGRPALLATALASAALIVGGVRHRTLPPPALSPTSHANPPAPSAGTPLHPDIPAPLLASEPRRTPTSTRSGHPSTSAGRSTANSDADLALAELRAPSQLAPPLPLTDDERALQHLAQRSSPDTLQALDATHRATEETDEKAAFDSFFTPPTFTEKQLKGESE